MTEDAPEGATPPTPEALVERAFGADSRRRMLDEYFANAGEVTPANAWQHVYRLLLWIDPTTGLAHCYESDKSQPGRPWYQRSLAFHDWVSQALRTEPSELANQIDWLFKKGTEVLAGAITRQMERRTTRAAEQRHPYQARGMPEPGQDPVLEQIIHEELGAYLAQQLPADVVQHFTQRVRTHFSQDKSDPVSWDTELARMTVTKEAGHGDEAEEAGDTAGAVQSTERTRGPRTMERPAEV